MEWKKVASKDTKQDCEDNFWLAIDIWTEKPHVVNKRLCGAVILAKLTTKLQYSNRDSRLYEVMKRKVEENLDDLGAAFDDLTHEYDGDEVDIIVRNLLTKQNEKYQAVMEVVILDRKKREVVYFPISNVTGSRGDVYMQSYMIHLVIDSSNNRIEVSVNAAENIVPHAHQDEAWLQSVLIPKLVKWTSQSQLQNVTSSLKLVALGRYNEIYQNMKVKYGKDLVQSWCESTDPQKFVYEELAIASYLMVLFEEEEQKCGKRQSFVDLGCGNGLLVYVLANEGYTGIGIDVRKRKIWDTYGPNVHLKECAIKPSAENLFKEYDWIIGNHSDELTPWIPVIAARSSYECKYFVLPCCPHDFNRKFNSRKPRCSLYQAYLDYVAQIGAHCGFHVECDSLRIPSTKRACFIGRTRIYAEINQTSIDRQLQNFIDERCCDNRNIDQKSDCSNTGDSYPVAKKFKSSVNKDNIEWTENFTPRESVEQVRNCTTIDRQLQESIVDRVFSAIVKDKNPSHIGNGRTWNKGIPIELSDVVKMFDKDCLRLLKKECGGIQTLLRNHNQIFTVAGGKVQLRYDVDERRPKQKNKFAKNPELFRKTKLCWFYEHHPDGCPHLSEKCQFAHGADELRITVKTVDNEK